MRVSKTFLAIGIVSVLVVSAATAQAASVASVLLAEGEDVALTLSDLSRQGLYTSAGTDGVWGTLDDVLDTTQTLSVGDTVFGILKIDNVLREPLDGTSTVNPGSSSSSGILGNTTLGIHEMTAVFAIRVKSLSTTDAQGNSLGTDGLGNQIYRIVFEPDPNFEAQDGGSSGSGTMLRFYDDWPLNYNPDPLDTLVTDADSDGSKIDDRRKYASDRAKDGTLFMEVGFTGTGFEFWEAEGGLNLSLLGDSANSTSAAQSNVSVNRTSSSGVAGNWLLAPNVYGTEISGQSVIFTGTGNTPWDARDNADFSLTVLPLPVAVVPGLMMIGLVAVTARRKRRAL